MSPTQSSREEAKAVFLSCYMDTPFDPPDFYGATEKIALALDAAKAKAWREGLRAGWARSSEMTNPYQSAPSDKEKAE